MTDAAWRAVRSALHISTQGPDAPDERFMDALRTFGFTVRPVTETPAVIDAALLGKAMRRWWTNPNDPPDSDPIPLIAAEYARLATSPSIEPDTGDTEEVGS